MVELLFHYIKSLTIIKDPNFHTKPNLALGHIITLIIEANYDIYFPIALDHLPYSFTGYYLHIFYG